MDNLSLIAHALCKTIAHALFKTYSTLQMLYIKSIPHHRCHEESIQHCRYHVESIPHCRCHVKPIPHRRCHVESIPHGMYHIADVVCKMLPIQQVQGVKSLLIAGFVCKLACIADVM